ncbi:Cyanovirin-N [Auriculariales sp. MPI-PUGE-AT-0066]|nr:Cyanovirin-N [Auriculariales sp. MPI-PUGE-AT-0066]
MRFSASVLSAALLVLAASANARNGFAQSCTGIGLVGSDRSLNLVATCTRLLGGNDGASQLNLNTCVGNNNGALLCTPEGSDYCAILNQPVTHFFLVFAGRGGNAFRSCSGCTITGSTIGCTCRNIAGGNVTSTFDLNTCIGNIDGFMLC